MVEMATEPEAEREEWRITVDPRFDKLADAAAKKGSYTTKAEFIRAAVREKIKRLMPDAVL